MIKIMIVDDMPVFREYLHNFIDWNAYGFEVCCEARDGKEALALYDTYLPDIVLTDIVMPYMDGLELSEALLQENPELSIILITGNSEFEYARKAVKLGVCDYIVKPFEKEELIIALLKLQDNISRVLELQNEKDQQKQEYREQMLRQFLYSNTSAVTYTSENIPFHYPYFLVITIRIDLYGNRTGSVETQQWKEILFSMLRNMIQIEGTLELIHDSEGNIVTILNFRDEADMQDYEGYEFEDICHLAKERIGLDLCVGISSYCHDYVNLRTAYFETIQALSQSYALHQTRIYDFRKLKLQTGREFYSWNLIENITHFLELNEYSRIEEMILTELDRIREYENPEYADMIYMSLLSLLFSYFVKIGRNMDDIFESSFHPYQIINHEPSYSKKRAFILACYQKAVQYELDHTDTRSSQIAKDAKLYIEQNYENPSLAIADISKELLVNQTYLRRMFKEKYQMTISDFITKIRMETAKELIQSDNNYKLSYISDKVGFSDSSYFSKCFKKYFGYPPSDIVNKQ